MNVIDTGSFFDYAWHVVAATGGFLGFLLLCGWVGKQLSRNRDDHTRR